LPINQQKGDNNVRFTIPAARTITTKSLSRLVLLASVGILLFQLGIPVVVAAAPLTKLDVDALQGPWPEWDPYGNGCAPTGANGNAPVIVLDPGHSGEDTDKAAKYGNGKPYLDKETGLHDHDYPSTSSEMHEVMTIATNMNKRLSAAGYKVIMTKSGETDTVSLRDRAEVANKNKATLAVSIHNDHGQAYSSFAAVYAQNMDGYRTNGAGKKITFPELAGSSAKTVSDASRAAANKIGAARQLAEHRPADDKHLITVNHFDGRAGIDPGNMAMVQLFAKVPWVYSEVGASPENKPMSDTQMKAYEDGLVKGIQDAVPLNNTAAAATDGAATPAAGDPAADPAAGGKVSMQKVDLADFKPAPQARSVFESDNLPKIKKHLNLYVQAAQAEGVTQNWEILAGLHGAEHGYGMDFKSNGFGAGYWGPFQEGPGELKDYLKDPKYAKDLATLVTPSGAGIPTDKLTDAQFIVLARLVFHRWIQQGLGNDYDKLKSGPVPFTTKVDSNNIFWKIMGRYNHGAEGYEGFNGYNPPEYPWGMVTEVGSHFQNLGIATEYYLLKEAEANGKLDVNVTGGTTSCDDAAAGPAVVCNSDTKTDGSASQAGATAGAATGAAPAGPGPTLLCLAKKYKGLYYLYGGGHGVSWERYQKICPDPSHPPNNQPHGKIGANGNSGNPSPCALDCSGLISKVVSEYTNKNFDVATGYWNGGPAAGSPDWKKLPNVTSAQAGDVVLRAEHIEFVDHYDAAKHILYTFGTRETGTKAGPASGSPGAWDYGAWRFTGKGK
jgi:N-acetylmuramoyl-L-alanine amidase